MTSFVNWNLPYDKVAKITAGDDSDQDMMMNILQIPDGYTPWEGRVKNLRSTQYPLSVKINKNRIYIEILGHNANKELQISLYADKARRKFTIIPEMQMAINEARNVYINALEDKRAWYEDLKERKRKKAK